MNIQWIQWIQYTIYNGYNKHEMFIWFFILFWANVFLINDWSIPFNFNLSLHNGHLKERRANIKTKACDLRTADLLQLSTIQLLLMAWLKRGIPDSHKHVHKWTLIDLEISNVLCTCSLIPEACDSCIHTRIYAHTWTHVETLSSQRFNNTKNKLHKVNTFIH